MIFWGAIDGNSVALPIKQKNNSIRPRHARGEMKVEGETIAQVDSITRGDSDKNKI